MFSLKLSTNILSLIKQTYKHTWKVDTIQLQKLYTGIHVQRKIIYLNLGNKKQLLQHLCIYAVPPSKPYLRSDIDVYMSYRPADHMLDQTLMCICRTARQTIC